MLASIPALGKQKQVGLSEFEENFILMVSSGPARDTQ